MVTPMWAVKAEDELPKQAIKLFHHFLFQIFLLIFKHIQAFALNIRAPIAIILIVKNLPECTMQDHKMTGST